MRNKLFIFGVLLCFALMILSLVGCFTAKQSDGYTKCFVIAKRHKDCKIWLNCQGRTESINNCDMIKHVQKYDVIQLKKADIK